MPYRHDRKKTNKKDKSTPSKLLKLKWKQNIYKKSNAIFYLTILVYDIKITLIERHHVLFSSSDWPL